MQLESGVEAQQVAAQYSNCWRVSTTLPQVPAD